MAYRLRGKELAFIRSQRVARVATSSADGVPHNVPISPVAVNGKFYFASSLNARKVRNLRCNPRIALCFDHYTEDWKRLAGVMIVGRATLIKQGVKFRRIRAALYRRYKLYSQLFPLEEGETVIVCVTPSKSFAWGL
jgi:nitroimidazol reductase NimA-like FMN-containing flavoprotein (pyridoxamine 5'-phosphate oxidase superfamily)